MLRTAGKFLGNQQGHIAITFAIAVVPIIMLTSYAVDVSQTYRKQSELQFAVESTALTLSRISMNNPAMTEAELVSIGKQMVYNKTNNPEVNFETFAIDTNGVAVQIKAQVEVGTFFTGVFESGLDHLDVNAGANAVFDRNNIDFYLLMDNTPSMGIAATPDDIQMAYNVTGALKNQGVLKESCAFACHNPPTEGLANSSDNMSYLQNAGVKLRIDAVEEAYVGLIDKMEEEAASNEKFRLAAFTFGEDSYNRQTKVISELTADYDALRSESSEIRLMRDYNFRFGPKDPASGHFGHSNFVEKLTHIRDKIDDDIDYLSEDNRRVLFLVTDGVHMTSRYASGGVTCLNGHKIIGGFNSCTMPVTESLCEDIKADGVRISVLYTEYIEFPGKPRWNILLRPVTDDIEPALINCASPGLYAKVEFGGESIKDAIQKMFNVAVRQLQLTSVDN